MKIKPTILLLLLSICATTISFAQKEKAVLDNQSFTIDLVEKNRMGKDEKTKDIISFDDGKISTKFSKDNGFPAAEYTTTSKQGLMGDIVTFKAESKGKKDTFVWEGVVNGDEIEGTATRERKGTIRTMYEFTGVLK